MHVMDTFCTPSSRQLILSSYQATTKMLSRGMISI